jgi:hypothetical protein
MRKSIRYLELFILVVIVYSLTTLIIELEYFGTVEPTGFLLWSEYVVAVIFTVEYVVRWIASRSLRYCGPWPSSMRSPFCHFTFPALSICDRFG